MLHGSLKQRAQLSSHVRIRMSGPSLRSKMRATLYTIFIEFYIQ